MLRYLIILPPFKGICFNLDLNDLVLYAQNEIKKMAYQSKIINFNDTSEIGL